MKILITPTQAAMLTRLPNGDSAISGKDYPKKKNNTENINMAPTGGTQTNTTQPQLSQNGATNGSV
jgi:hypothetical protein